MIIYIILYVHIINNVHKIAAEEKYDLILQEAVYRSDRLDITDKVIKALEDD